MFLHWYSGKLFTKIPLQSNHEVSKTCKRPPAWLYVAFMNYGYEFHIMATFHRSVVLLSNYFPAFQLCPTCSNRWCTNLKSQETIWSSQKHINDWQAALVVKTVSWSRIWPEQQPPLGHLFSLNHCKLVQVCSVLRGMNIFCCYQWQDQGAKLTEEKNQLVRAPLVPWLGVVLPQVVVPQGVVLPQQDTWAGPGEVAPAACVLTARFVLWRPTSPAPDSATEVHALHRPFVLLILFFLLIAGNATQCKLAKFHSVHTHTHSKLPSLWHGL